MTATAVVDTNVIVAAVLTSDQQSPPARILDGMLTRSFRFLLSVELLAEYRSVLLRPRIRGLHGLTEQEVDQLLEALVTNAVLQEGLPSVSERPPDPGDLHLWRLLAARQGAVLVTGDAALQRSPPAFAGVLSPASFGALLRL